MNKPYSQPGEKGTDTNQASEDELTYGVDLGIPGGDFTALSIKKGSTLFTFTGDEAVAIIDVIRTEKIKLLAEVRERVIGEDEPGVTNIMIAAEHAKQIDALTKLEAEL